MRVLKSYWEWLKMGLKNRNSRKDHLSEPISIPGGIVRDVIVEPISIRSGAVKDVIAEPISISSAIVKDVIEKLLNASSQDECFEQVVLLRLFGKSSVRPLLEAITLITPDGREFFECQARLAFALANISPPATDELIAALDDQSAAVRLLADKALRQMLEVAAK